MSMSYPDTVSPSSINEPERIRIAGALIDRRLVAGISAKPPACVLFNDGTRLDVTVEEAQALIDHWNSQEVKALPEPVMGGKLLRLIHLSIHVVDAGDGRANVEVFRNGRISASFLPKLHAEALELADHLSHNDCARCGLGFKSKHPDVSLADHPPQSSR